MTQPGYIGHLGQQGHDDTLANNAEAAPQLDPLLTPSFFATLRAWLDKTFPAQLDEL